MPSRCRAIVAGLMLLCAARVDGAQWVRVETPNFVVFGEVGEKRTRDVAAEFERFREALARVLPGAAPKAPVPTTVVVFDNRKSFEPYRPLYNGKPIDVAGYFSSDRDVNRVALALEDRTQGLRIIFHEYVHLVVSNITDNIPSWLNEGLAEYYSTFLVTDEGKTATMGTVIEPHLIMLNQEQLLPLKDLLAVTHDSPLYNEGQRRGMFYAESWALVHLLLSSDDRSRQLGEYARVTGAGVPAAAAWQQVFGAYDPLPDLRRYVKQFSVRGFRYHFKEGIDTVKGDAVKLTDAEIETTLGDELLGVRRAEDAEARLKKAMTLQPPAARAKALLGLQRVNDGNHDEARKLLMEAAGERSDWLTQYYVASGLGNMVQSDDAALADAARQAIGSVLAVRPDLPHALALQGRIAMATRKDVDAAALAVQRARMLAPGREDYAFLEATLHLVRRDYHAAREILAPMMSGRYPESVRDRARLLMGQAVTFEQREREYAAQRDAPSAPAPPPGGAASAAPGAGEEPTVRPIFRTIEAGEQRTEGILERITCAAPGAMLEVRSDGILLKFAVSRLDQVDFISYRQSLTGAIGCGVRTPPDHVYVTWRGGDTVSPAAHGTTGRAVAVEFLPK
jgi:tetratricopeptide (TPR) repeat protein